MVQQLLVARPLKKTDLLAIVAPKTYFLEIYKTTNNQKEKQNTQKIQIRTRINFLIISNLQTWTNKRPKSNEHFTDQSSSITMLKFWYYFSSSFLSHLYFSLLSFCLHYSYHPCCVLCIHVYLCVHVCACTYMCLWICVWICVCKHCDPWIWAFSGMSPWFPGRVSMTYIFPISVDCPGKKYLGCSFVLLTSIEFSFFYGRFVFPLVKWLNVLFPQT